MTKFAGTHQILVDIRIFRDGDRGPFARSWFWQFTKDTAVYGPFSSAKIAFEDAKTRFRE